ncbi:MAG: hypothetical protein M3125_00490 [Gemmatimonadota bacterium]|nr:hypothetical protein [Gemmatimonadota bacterium]
MVIHPVAHGANESVFAMFATRARRRASHSLVRQLIVCGVAAVFIVLIASPAWPAAAALGAGACYAAWGLLDRHERSRVGVVAMRALAGLATALVVSFCVGLALAAFTGDAPSPKGTCYDANGRAFACDARGQRR